jgi:hypothetical protein
MRHTASASRGARVYQQVAIITILLLCYYYYHKKQGAKGGVGVVGVGVCVTVPLHTPACNQRLSLEESWPEGKNALSLVARECALGGAAVT